MQHLSISQPPTKLGAELERIRAEKGMSCRKFASFLHLSAPHYIGIIRGERACGLKAQRAILKQFPGLAHLVVLDLSGG